MRRIIAIAGAVALTAAVAAPAVATPPDEDGNHKVLVCHATSRNSDDYYNRIIVDIAATSEKDERVIATHFLHTAEGAPNKHDKDGNLRFDLIFEGWWEDGDEPECTSNEPPG